MKSIGFRLLLLTMPIMLVLLTGLGYYAYLESTKLVTRSTQSNLQTIVAAKQEALLAHVESAEKLGSAIAASETIQSWGELVNRNLSGRNQETVEQRAQLVESLISSLQETHWGRYNHIFLIDRSNRIVISPSHGAFEKETSSPLMGRDMSSNPWTMETMQKGLVTVSEFSSRQVSVPDLQHVFVPVRDASNRVQAVIGIELPTPHLQQILKDGFDVGQTGRIYLATDKGVPLVQKGLDNQGPLGSESLAQAKLKGHWSGKYMNSRGREVFGFFVQSTGYPWVLVAEVETDEVFADLYRLLVILGGGLGASLVILLLLLVKFARGTSQPLRELAGYVEKLSLGEFNIEIPDSDRRDEIGNLTGALQRHVFSLQLVAKKLRDAKALKTKIMKTKAIKKAS